MTKAPPRALALLLAAALAGCGGSGAPAASVPATPIPANLITATDVAAAQPGSPTAVTLQWFQAVQFQDIPSLRRLTTPAALKGVSDAALSMWLSTFGPGFARPQITAALTTGTTTSVRMLLLSYRAAARTPASAEPFTIALVRSGASWLVRDIALLRAYAKASHLSYPSHLLSNAVAGTAGRRVTRP